jgi:hypothetical protein
MTLLEQVLEARKRAEGKPPCKTCIHLLWIDESTPFCKIKDKFILPDFPPNKCELRESEDENAKG